MAYFAIQWNVIESLNVDDEEKRLVDFDSPQQATADKSNYELLHARLVFNLFTSTLYRQLLSNYLFESTNREMSESEWVNSSPLYIIVYLE